MKTEYFLRIDPFDMQPHVVSGVRPTTGDTKGTQLDLFYRECKCDTIDVVHTRWTFGDQRIIMVCDDNALINGLQSFNALATMIYCSRSQIFGPVIVGLIGEYEGEPDVVGFDDQTDAEFAAIMIRQRIAGVDEDPLEWDIRD